MSIGYNKRMAVEFVEASCAHDGPKFDSLLHPDATYWVIGTPPRFAFGGEALARAHPLEQQVVGRSGHVSIVSATRVASASASRPVRRS